MTRSHRVSHGLLKATALALLSAYAGAASHGGHEPECSLPPNIRPVVQVNGFGSGVLFDQSAEPFRVAFPDLDPGPNDGFFGSPEADLSLPLTWNAANLTQDASILGSEGAPEDMLPGLVGPVRDALIQVRESAASGCAIGKIAMYMSPRSESTVIGLTVLRGNVRLWCMCSSLAAVCEEFVVILPPALSSCVIDARLPPRTSYNQSHITGDLEPVSIAIGAQAISLPSGTQICFECITRFYGMLHLYKT